MQQNYDYPTNREQYNRTQPNNIQMPTYSREHPVPSTNGMGTAGFVLAIITLCFSWLPYIGGVTWILGLIFSVIGMGQKPRGLAIAGFVISLVSIVILLAIIFLGAFALLMFH